nr:1-aminocyclopropane-1-carboxylate synthase-like [Ipomoea batatas]
MDLKSMRQQTQILPKIATNDGHGENSAYFDGWKAYDNNPFHPKHNIILRVLAENQLCFDLINKWVLNNPICTPQGAEEFKDIAIYQDYHGLPEFRSNGDCCILIYKLVDRKQITETEC